MKYLLLINDSSKKLSEMVEYGNYNTPEEIPLVKNTILTIDFDRDDK